MKIDFGKKILDLRKHLNITQASFGDTIGISRVRVAQIELNKNKPTLEILIEVINNFKVSADYFFNNNIGIGGVTNYNNDINNYSSVAEREPENLKELVSDSKLELLNQGLINQIESKDQVISAKEQLISNQAEMILILKEQLKHNYNK